MPARDSRHADSHRQFATTHWSLVLEAAQDTSETSEQALAELCEIYWYPLYAYVRRQGHTSEDAQDLTQGFFARLLEKRDLQTVDQEKGRFRSFLMACMKHFLINEWDKRKATKRGGGQAILSLDFEGAESRFARGSVDQRTPEAVFDREWALTTLANVRARLSDEQDVSKKSDQFETLQVYLTGDANLPSYREAGQSLGMSEGAVKVAVHRMRNRFAQLLREHIGQTVAEEEEIDDEIRALMDALRT